MLRKLDEKNSPVSTSSKVKKQRHPLVTAALIIFAIGATLIFGLVVCGFAVWFASKMIEGPGGGYLDNDGAKVVVLSAMVAATLVLFVMRLIWSKRKDPVYATMIGCMWAGLAFIGLAGVFGIVGLYNNNPPIFTDDGAQNSRCSTLANQHGTAIAATIPIGTDKGYGTAFAIDKSGKYLTAYHVVDGASEVFINTVKGRQSLTVTQMAPEYDVALLSGPSQDAALHLTTVAQQTDEVYAVGYSGNALTAGGASVSRGIISRLLSVDDMKLNDPASPDGLEIVQTDAAVNPGNSGGALVNHCGVVGVMSSMSDSNQLHKYGVSSEQGISYAISARTIAQRFSLPILEQ